MVSNVISQWKLVSVDQPEVSPLPMSDRLRSQLVYVMTTPDTPVTPVVNEGEYWIARGDVTR
jgi:hypothetical protein